jgi:ATP-binding cassette subfamily F protein uup
MQNLVTLENICLHFGDKILLDKVNLQINHGERVCLIGANGAGKSSLLKIIEGSLSADDGSIRYAPHLKLAKLTQDLPQETQETVFEFVAKGLASIGQLLNSYYQLTQTLRGSSNAADLKKLDQLQQTLDQQNGWQYEQKINEVLSRLQLNPERKVSELSGGWQRRVTLAQALVTSPDLLLLDEPTNHLDIETIHWLENKLLNWHIGIIFITHDRALLQRLATRIIELDRGTLTSWPGDYANFLKRKEAWLQAQATQQAKFDKRLAEEELWIRKGIRARRTRNEGRVRALKSMRMERAKRREQLGKAKLTLTQATESGNLVIEAKNITQQYNNQLVIDNFSMRIMRGDRIGLIGPNGVGKSTLLNILLKNISPQQGEVRHGTKLKIAYFDQLRASLDVNKTVLENVMHSGDTVEVNGKPRHIMGYLADFLFTSERARTLVKRLSGGECNRLLLAKLFTQPTNLLVLDEPTNDLDIDTLELLEELLCNYQGTLLIVSHDRAFLDNVVTSTLVFEEKHKIREYIGGYSDWLRQQKTPNNKTKKQKQHQHKADKPAGKSPTGKLSYHEQQELKSLPKKIEQLEAEQSALTATISSENFYQSPTEAINTTLAKLKSVSEEITQAYKRWESLESKR